MLGLRRAGNNEYKWLSEKQQHQMFKRGVVLASKRLLTGSLGARNIHGSGVCKNAPADVGQMFSHLDMLSMSKLPINNIESCLKDGIRLSNGIVIRSPNKENHIIASVLIMGDAFEVNLSGKTNDGAPLYLITNNFLVKLAPEVLRIFELLYPKPELVVIGLGKKSRILHESNRKFFSNMGVQVEISDTRNGCQNFDLLATERPNQIAGFLLPPNL